MKLVLPDPASRISTDAASNDDLGWADIQSKLLSAASAATAAATDLIECAHHETDIFVSSNVGSGETLSCLADAARLLIQANNCPMRDNQLLGALEKWLREEGYLHD